MKPRTWQRTEVSAKKNTSDCNQRKAKLFPQSKDTKPTLTFTVIKKLVLGPRRSEQVKPGMHKSSKTVRHASKFEAQAGWYKASSFLRTRNH